MRYVSVEENKHYWQQYTVDSNEQINSRQRKPFTLEIVHIPNHQQSSSGQSDHEGGHQEPQLVVNVAVKGLKSQN